MATKVEDTREYRRGLIDGTTYTKQMIDAILDRKITDKQKLRIIKASLDIAEELSKPNKSEE